MKGSIFHSLFISTLLIFMVSCQYVQENTNPFEDNSILGDIRHSTHLEFLAFFDECGEFGGHTEKIIIYRDAENEVLYADFLVDTATCPFRDSLEFQKFQTVMVKGKNESIVVGYLETLLNNSLKNQFPLSNAGKFYKAIKYSDSNPNTTMVLEYFIDSSYNWQPFERLKADLGIKSINLKGRTNPS